MTPNTRSGILRVRNQQWTKSCHHARRVRSKYRARILHRPFSGHDLRFGCLPWSTVTAAGNGRPMTGPALSAASGELRAIAALVLAARGAVFFCVGFVAWHVPHVRATIGTLRGRLSRIQNPPIRSRHRRHRDRSYSLGSAEGMSWRQ